MVLEAVPDVEKPDAMVGNLVAAFTPPVLPVEVPAM
jgi:hypothetical protein